ncbi:hypothetical protein [Streptomyces tanashiensis]|uniref:hypothetical protein n=1 Tax=Streptomyces tanashiensis TaxID=67367 RepID=UPI0033E4CD33
MPFRDVFSRLKNVSLAELRDIAAPPETDVSDVAVRRIQLDAVHAVATLAGGVAVGAGAGAATFAQEVLPRFRVVRDALAGDRPDLVLAELAELTRRFGGRPVYGTQQEFDAWMLDESATLVLDPHW